MNLERLMQTVLAVGGAAMGIMIIVHESIAVHGSKGLIHDIGFAVVFGIIGALIGFVCGLPAAFLLALVIMIPLYALEGIRKAFHLSEGDETNTSSVSLQSHSNRESPPSNPRSKLQPRRRRF